MIALAGVLFGFYGISLMIPVPAMLSYSIILVSCFCMAFLSTLFSIRIMSYLQIIVPAELMGKIVSCVMCIGMCASPIYLLLSMYSDQPERMEEALAILDGQIEEFFRIYRKV